MTQDEIQAVALRNLVSAVINDYHTTRLADVSPVDHILSKPRTQAAIAALDAARGDPVAQVVEWLRKENGICDCHARCETECGCGAWDDWKTKPLLQIADQIEQGEPFNG